MVQTRLDPEWSSCKRIRIYLLITVHLSRASNVFKNPVTTQSGWNQPPVYVTILHIYLHKQLKHLATSSSSWFSHESSSCSSFSTVDWYPEFTYKYELHFTMFTHDWLLEVKIVCTENLSQRQADHKLTYAVHSRYSQPANWNSVGAAQLWVLSAMFGNSSCQFSPNSEKYSIFLLSKENIEQKWAGRNSGSQPMGHDPHRYLKDNYITNHKSNKITVIK